MKRRLGRRLARCAASAGLGAVYGMATLLSRRLARHDRGPAGRSGCILVIGTFHNPNWFHAHIRPLVRSGIGEVLLVCDEVVEPMSKVRFECPPRWLQLVLTRAGAKLVWALRCAVRYRPDVYMGYHIFPCAVIALVLARLFGRPASYQVTSGPLELEGGGWHAENRILTGLGGPSAFVERRAAGLLREFDSVIVRGSGAAAYVRELGYRHSLCVITGSVEPKGPWRDRAARPIDVVFVGRLTEYKRPDRFVAVVAAIAQTLPDVRAVLIGDGPDAAALKMQVAGLKLERNVRFLGKRADVDALLATAKVFVLTSRWEGVSIAMLEAMAAGAVPVVANVGDLGDSIQHGVNGYIVEQGDIDAYARAAVHLLIDADAWRGCSQHAVKFALDTSGTDAIAKRWERHLRGVPAALRRTSAVAFANDATDSKLR